MRRPFALIGLSLCLVMPAYAAPIDINGGVEQFAWKEFNSSGNQQLKESGRRLFIGVEAKNEVSERWTYGFRGRLYSGAVDCDGQLKGGLACATVDSDYDGVAMAATFTGRFIRADGNYSNLGLRLGVGGEAWRRSVTGTVAYTEKFFVVYGNLGLAYIPQRGFFGDAGVKYPLSVDVDIDLYDDASLSPKGALSTYATIGYNFNQRWSIKGYYDTYRFNESDPEPLTNSGAPMGTVAQPESSMDAYGISVGFYF